MATGAVAADPASPVTRAADAVAVLDFADEESVVQTRFATANLALLRAQLESEGALPAGVRPLDDAIRHAERALTEPLGAAVSGAEQFTFLGSGWTCGLALEAALKMREAAGAWTEAYPAMEYRHGPISITGPGRIAWVFGELPEGLADDIDRVGGTLVADSATPTGLDPRADPVRAQRPPRGRGAASAPRPRPAVRPPAAPARGGPAGLRPPARVRWVRGGPRARHRPPLRGRAPDGGPVPVILTVTPNAALDVTYGVDNLRPNTSHRVRTAHRRAGGEGVSVPRVLAARAGRRPPRPRAVHGPGARGRATRLHLRHVRRLHAPLRAEPEGDPGDHRPLPCPWR